MKLLFYAQHLGDAHLAEALATLFREPLDLSNVSAITFTEALEANYLRYETNGLFRQVLSETVMHRAASRVEVSQDFLNTLEPRYGLPFWHYVTDNRFLFLRRANHRYDLGTDFSREELVKHVQVRFEMTERFMDEVKPDAVIFPVDVGSSSALVLERVARARNIPVFVPISSRLGSYHTMIDTVFSRARNVEKRFEALQAGLPSENVDNARALISNFREGNVTITYLQNAFTENLEKGMTLGGVANRIKDNIVRRVRKPVFTRKNNDVFQLSQLEYDLHRATIHVRNFRLRLGRYFEAPSVGEKFVFFPFHVEPELSLLLYAPYHTHQTSVVQNVAQSLPWDTALYAKEHPLSVGMKPMGFYKRVKQTPNVRLIYPHLPSRTLIAASRGVVTITGTAGVEAMLMGKPVVTLGDVFYNFVPSLVQHAKSTEALPELLRTFENFTPNEPLLETFVTALLDESIAVDPEQLGKRLVGLPLEAKLNDPSLQHYGAFLTQRLLERLYPATPQSDTKQSFHLEQTLQAR
jgi:hypothetical protein